MRTEHEHEDTRTPAQFWEDRYADTDRVWSGRPNRVLVDVIATMEPGRALDLGCGEGADAIWLAEHGWTVTGVDISATAVARGRLAAEPHRFAPGRLRLLAADLATWAPDGVFDLVTASFFQSPVDLPASDILRRAAGALRRDGSLLITAHAAPPPWAPADMRRDHRFMSPQEQITAIGLPEGEWDSLIAETREREANDPDGNPSTLEDSVVMLRRR